MWLNFSWVNNMFIYYPIVLIVITLVILYLPFKTLYYRSRAWWAYSNVSPSTRKDIAILDTNHKVIVQWRLWLSGLYPVEFRDFFLGDMYCSQTYAMGVRFDLRALRAACAELGLRTSSSSSAFMPRTGRILPSAAPPGPGCWDSSPPCRLSGAVYNAYGATIRRGMCFLTWQTL